MAQADTSEMGPNRMEAKTPLPRDKARRSGGQSGGGRGNIAPFKIRERIAAIAGGPSTWKRGDEQVDPVQGPRRAGKGKGGKT